MPKMKLRPPKKEVVDAWVEVYEKQSWGSDRSPRETAEALAKEVGHLLGEHHSSRHLGVQVRFETEAQCPECGKPYESETEGEWAGHCAWNGCDLREPEGGPEVDDA